MPSVIFTLFAKAGAVPLNSFFNRSFFFPSHCSGDAVVASSILKSWNSSLSCASLSSSVLMIFDFLNLFIDMVHFLVQMGQSCIIWWMTSVTWMALVFFQSTLWAELFSYYFMRYRSRSQEDLAFTWLIRSKANANSLVRPQLSICGGPLGMESKASVVSGVSILFKVFPFRTFQKTWTHWKLWCSQVQTKFLLLRTWYSWDCLRM